MIVAKQLSGLLVILLSSVVWGREAASDSTAATSPESLVTSTSPRDLPARAETKDSPVLVFTKDLVPENSPLGSSQQTYNDVKNPEVTVLSGEENVDANDVVDVKYLVPVVTNDEVPDNTLQMDADKIEDTEDKNSATTKQPTELVVLGDGNSTSDTSEDDSNETDLKPQNKVSKTTPSTNKGGNKGKESLPNNAAIFFAFLEPMFVREPVYVNLTGIKGYSGRERMVTEGCLDLSGLQLTGKEAKEVIWRMSRYQFSRIDLSNNSITEVAPNTFSPVAFMVQELRLDGNPLGGGGGGGGGEEFSLVRWGGLFHLPDLRKLNLSNCGLRDMDSLTPWNSDLLQILDLSRNKLDTVPANLQYFHKLKSLYLVDNPITEIEEMPLALLWNLQVLDFTGCKVASIKGDPLKNMANLKELSLMDNRLTHISELRLPVSWRLRLYLSGNSWHCDNDMISFIEWYFDSIYDFEYLNCGSPWWLKGMHVAFLSEEIVALGKEDQPDTLDSAGEGQLQFIPLDTERLHFFALTTFVFALFCLLVHLLCTKRRDKISANNPEKRCDVAYISIDKKPSCT